MRKIKLRKKAIILNGDCLQGLKQIPDQLIQTCVTSPPYFGLRDYGCDGQIGLEETPEQYVQKLVEVFREVRRTLKDDGTLWLNIGDSYAANRTYLVEPTLGKGRGSGNARAVKGKGSKVPDGMKQKDLIGIPWMLAFALRADGWYLRQDIIWHKPNPMPESVVDRCTKAHEYIFLLSKKRKYLFDSEAIKEAAVSAGRIPGGNKGVLDDVRFRRDAGRDMNVPVGEKRNRRSVWSVATKPYSGAHFAVYPPALIEPCILAGTSEKGHCPKCGAHATRVFKKREPTSTGAAIGGDPTRKDGGTRERDSSGWGGNSLATTRLATDEWEYPCSCGVPYVSDIVLDPFNGSGTTGQVALEHGRRYVGCELNPEYVELTLARLKPLIKSADKSLFKKNREKQDE